MYQEAVIAVTIVVSIPIIAQAHANPLNSSITENPYYNTTSTEFLLTTSPLLNPVTISIFKKYKNLPHFPQVSV